MTSLWLDDVPRLADDPLPVDEQLDDLVVGAGLTGLTTALLLARAGRRVAVVEARYVGAVATGNTTAKLSLLQGTRLSRILGRQSHHVAEAYVEANREGQQWLLRFCDDHGVPVQRRDAATFALDEGEVRTVRQEHEAAESLSLPVTWTDSLDVPFPVHGATVLADQAQFDPLDVLHALAEQLRAHGGTLHQGHRVRKVSRTGAPKATLDDGTVLRAEDLVLATGIPVLDRGFYFAKVEPQRSYALAFDSTDAPEGMYLSAGSDSRSVRDAPSADGTRLLIGGAGHTVGRTRSEAEHVDRLREWTATYFPDAVETHQWSAQDYKPHDGIPFMGKLPRGGGRIYLATGFEKWGMTNGVAAARSISEEILGGERPSWSKTLGHRVTRPSGALEAAGINAKVGLALAGGVVRSALQKAPEDPTPGTEKVGRDGLVPTGRTRTEDGSCAVVGVCTHLGGILEWNDAERSWDCPLHGSRFAPDGTVLEGPATRPLLRRDDG
jgi:glycine/D-amino acid oxidase-like deaminating enzyme/nitrite reductase/ring-hydroxylating ferredoxin subunit